MAGFTKADKWEIYTMPWWSNKFGIVTDLLGLQFAVFPEPLSRLAMRLGDICRPGYSRNIRRGIILADRYEKARKARIRHVPYGTLVVRGDGGGYRPWESGDGAPDGILQHGACFRDGKGICK